ncbi:universal stress protein [Lutibacter sp. A80]|uniref:universal stress protein n=1 Tax=Lutibacter sp. A80 TaxID=2918453 RepID=UPI001F0681C2|nr:universal stress protein [Lutibacter sp. A80]UMB60546.1 universal stress protein [Lutibacter sp. A80]
MKTIICAIDYSKNGIAALKYAYTLNTKINSKLCILHITDIFSLESLTKEELKKKLYFKLKYFCVKHLGDNLDSKNIEIKIIENTSVIEGITATAIKIKASLILTGLKGKGILKSFFIGSTTKDLISKATCPVLAIPKKYELKKMGAIVYATAYEQEDIYAIMQLTKIAAAFNAEIKIIHISPQNEKNGVQQMQNLKRTLLKNTTYKKITFNTYHSNDTCYFLKMYLLEIKADMVAMLERNKNKTMLSKVFKNDMVIDMEISGELPLISFNEKNFNEKNF